MARSIDLVLDTRDPISSPMDAPRFNALLDRNTASCETGGRDQSDSSALPTFSTSAVDIINSKGNAIRAPQRTHGSWQQSRIRSSSVRAPQNLLRIQLSPALAASRRLQSIPKGICFEGMGFCFPKSCLESHCPQCILFNKRG